jgi:hypothetical protein
MPNTAKEIQAGGIDLSELKPEDFRPVTVDQLGGSLKRLATGGKKRK